MGSSSDVELPLQAIQTSHLHDRERKCIDWSPRKIADVQGIAPKGEWDLPVEEAVRKWPHTGTESETDEQMMLPERDFTTATLTLSSRLPL